MNELLGRAPFGGECYDERQNGADSGHRYEEPLVDEVKDVAKNVRLRLATPDGVKSELFAEGSVQSNKGKVGREENEKKRM